MKKKKLMILGASILQNPAIIKAKELGLEVIAVDMDKNAPGFQYSDISLNISTNDIAEVLVAAKEYKIDGIMTLASDMPMRTIARVVRELNLVGISEETALKATNKAVMRQCLKENNVPIPEFYRVESYQEYLHAIQHFKSKFMVKPADNSGSRGVYLVENNRKLEEIDYAYYYSKQFSNSGEIVVEEYMEGPEVSVEILCYKGNINIIAITDKLTSGEPRFVEMGHSQPSQLSLDIREQIEEVATLAVKAIGIKNGPSHCEIIVTNHGPKIVELGARLGGDNITSHLVPLSTGIDLVECCIKIAIDEIPQLGTPIKKASAIRYFKSFPGKIVGIHGVDAASQIANIKQISFMKKVGEFVGDINSSTDRIGFVIAKADEPEYAIKECEKAIEKITIDIEASEENL